jgi:cytochrome b561
MKSARAGAAIAGRPMVAADRERRYDGVAVGLHWTTAVLVLLQFGLAETWSWFPRPTLHLMFMAHMSFGILLAAVVAGRIVWRLMPVRPPLPAAAGLAEFAATIVHGLLYAMLTLQVLLGFVLRWSDHEAMNFFGLLIPPMIPTVPAPAHEVMADVHHWAGWAMVMLAGGHAATALYHHFVARDLILTRMAPWLRQRPA